VKPQSIPQSSEAPLANSTKSEEATGSNGTEENSSISAETIVQAAAASATPSETEQQDASKAITVEDSDGGSNDEGNKMEVENGAEVGNKTEEPKEEVIIFIVQMWSKQT
jgi:hypothetical protein